MPLVVQDYHLAARLRDELKSREQDDPVAVLQHRMQCCVDAQDFTVRQICVQPPSAVQETTHFRPRALHSVGIQLQLVAVKRFMPHQDHAHGTALMSSGWEHPCSLVKGVHLHRLLRRFQEGPRTFAVKFKVHPKRCRSLHKCTP